MRKFLSTLLLSLIAFSTAFSQDPVFTVPAQFGQPSIFYSLNDNWLYAATDRFSVSSTLQNDRTRLIFDQDYDHPAITVPAGQSTTVSIDLRGKGGSYVQDPAGYIRLSFYDMHNPDSIYLRLYDTTGDFADFYFSDWNNVSNTSPYLLWNIHAPIWLTKLTKIEFKIFAPSTDSTVLTEMEYYLQYPTPFEGGIVNKFTNNTLWRDLTFRDTGNVKRAFIHSNGNGFLSKLGIGVDNTNDTFKLSVAGAIHGQKLLIDHKNWPDYVFSKGYRLPPLSKLESYINANKHLPDVPSADQVKKQGIDVGETQAILLRKIEELTQYMIQQDKTLRKQQQQIRHLEKRLRTIK